MTSSNPPVPVRKDGREPPPLSGGLELGGLHNTDFLVGQSVELVDQLVDLFIHGILKSLDSRPSFRVGTSPLRFAEQAFLFSGIEGFLVGLRLKMGGLPLYSGRLAGLIAPKGFECV
jgi:hypothetical protein